MNILFISRNSPFESIGGIERYITNLITYYKTQAHSQLYLLLPTEKEEYFEKEGNVSIHYTPSLSLSRSSLTPSKDVSKKAQAFSETLVKLIDKYTIDIICAENFHNDLPPAYSLLLNMVTSQTNIPLILQLHSFATTELQTELINQLKWDRISCVSTSVAGDCFQKGADINSLATHYLGVDTHVFNSEQATTQLKEHLGLTEKNKIILTASRIIRGKDNILQEKGLINLIQAFSRFASRYPYLKLLIAIGKPPENLKEEFNLAFEMLQGYLKLHNVEKQTILKMFKLHEMPDVYKGSDIFVLPSENETFGQVFIEAMSCGVPVIGTKVGGIPEIISDSYNGYLVPPDDSSILAQKIEKLMYDSSTRKRFISAGKKTVGEKFTSEQQFSAFNAMLEEAVSNSSSVNTNVTTQFVNGKL